MFLNLQTVYIDKSASGLTPHEKKSIRNGSSIPKAELSDTLFVVIIQPMSMFYTVSDANHDNNKK